ncbi:MAG: serine/threonine protein kinase, partial [Planctomycetaceae bacterium]|nr:serine/threonine protein kinase [Planctomycetaceae bacterium]
MAAGSDRNLLFGILAYQMEFVSREQLLDGMHAWMKEKSRPLGELFRELGALDAETHQLLDALVKKHLKQHGDDPQKSLAAVSSIKSVRQDLEQLADPDVEASLVHVSQNPESVDPYATQAGTVGDSTSKGTRFRILRPHAKGGLGQVSVALDEELRREVALKEIQPEHAHRDESRGRFLVEAEVTGGLEHPGIVPVYGLGTYADGRPYYAMRFIRGDSLKAAIERFHSTNWTGRDSEQVLELRKLLGRFVDVCNAIAYAHSRGVLHRDLKPGNIMLG